MFRLIIGEWLTWFVVFIFILVNPKPGARSPRPENRTRIPKPETRSPMPKTGNPWTLKPETRKVNP